MTRPIRYGRQFVAELETRVRWLREHRPAEQIANLAEALATFTLRVARFPAVGCEAYRRGDMSYRVAPMSDALPYLVWYSYDHAKPNGEITLLMLTHESQDRERFDPDGFE